jgi:hypothetical protein
MSCALSLYSVSTHPSPKHSLSVGRKNVEIWDTFLWVPICFHKSFKTMTQVWSCSQQVVLDYPIVLYFNTRAPNQTLRVGRNIKCDYYILGWSFNLEKESIWFVCIFWTLVLSPCQPTFSLESGPFENKFQITMWQAKWHWAVFTQTPFSHLWRFHVDLVIVFLRLVSSVFLLWQISRTWWICFQKMKKSIKILRFLWRVFPPTSWNILRV